MNSESLIDIQNLNFSYGQTQILRNIFFQVRAAETVSLIGSSGCGKSTLLNLIAGTQRGAQGSMAKSGLWRRVYQNQALFPWMTVEENIKLGLRGRGAKQALDFQKLVKKLELNHSLGLYPRQLSGGLRQRTEIARALIGKPDGLFMDEPFSSLDYLLRREITDHLKQLLEEHQIALVLVTHDIPEALSLTATTYLLAGRPAEFFKSYSGQSHESSQVLTERIWQDIKSQKGLT